MRGLSRVGNDDIYRTKLISRLTFSFTKHKLLIYKGFNLRYTSLQGMYLINTSRVGLMIYK